MNSTVSIKQERIQWKFVTLQQASFCHARYSYINALQLLRLYALQERGLQRDVLVLFLMFMILKNFAQHCSIF